MNKRCDEHITVSAKMLGMTVHSLPALIPGPFGATKALLSG